MVSRIKEGMVFIISAPSGAGKSTLAKAVLSRDKRFAHPVSYTTRAARSGEQDGRDYHFVTQEKFQRLARQGQLLETAFVHGAWYAAPRREVERLLKQGFYVLFAIDIQGARSLAKIFKQCVTIFLLPPDKATWLTRLRRRQEARWAERMAHGRFELTQMSQYDYCLVNDDLSGTVEDFLSIVRAEELSIQRVKGLRVTNAPRLTKVS